MTIIQIKLKDAYVDHLLAIISSHQEIPIEEIAIEDSSKIDYTQKQLKKQKPMSKAK